jgi:hypothetical protein
MSPSVSRYVTIGARNPGTALKPEWFESVQVNLSATEPVRTSYPPIELDGHRVRVEEVIENDVARRRRTWRSTLTVDGAEFSFSRRSYYLRHQELERMMLRAGLTDVRRADVRGEHYDVFVGRRP